MSIFDFEVPTANDDILKLNQLQGSVVLIVNVASKCGFTKQYQQLQQYYERYCQQGFTILAFPCNQFGQQEPHDNQQIQVFCRNRFAVTFPVMAKIDVKGDEQHPLFAYLTSQKSGLVGTKSIKWNFTKFLCDRQGQVVQRFPPASIGDKLENAIKNCL